MTLHEILLAFKAGRLSKAEAQQQLRQLPAPARGIRLSEGQRGLWALHQIAPGMAAYNVPLCYRVRGRIDEGAFRRACHRLQERTPLLASAVKIKDAALRFVRHRHQVDVELVSQPNASDAELLAFLRQRLKAPFDLERGPLVRLHLVSRSDTDHVLLFALHHLVVDDGSIAPLMTAFADSYGPCDSREPVANDDALYEEFVDWEQQLIGGATGRMHRDYWTRQLTGHSTLELPTDRARPPMQVFDGESRSRVVPPNLDRALRAFARARRVSLATVYLGVYQAVLSRYTQQDDIVVGVPTLGRQREEFDALVGYYVNTIAVRSRHVGSQTFESLIKDVHHSLAEGLEHAHYPLPRLVQELHIERSPDRSPLFQTTFAFKSDARVKAAFGLCDEQGNAIRLEPLYDLHQEGAFELELEVRDGSDGCVATFKYQPALFDAATIDRFADHYVRLASLVLDHPDRRLRQHAIVSNTERHTMLYRWNARHDQYPDQACLHELIEAQSRRSPDAVALVCGDRSLTYRELDDRSTAIARGLRALELGSGSLIGVCLDRSLDLPVGLLGILKAGAAYVPLDPQHPDNRLAYIIEDSAVQCVLADDDLLTRLTRLSAPSVQVHALGDVRREMFLGPSRPAISPDTFSAKQLAYVIYTSGSTGQPKGVMVSHEALVNCLVSMSKVPGLRAMDRLLAVTTCSFDIAALEVFLPLLAGAQTIVCPAAVARDGHALAREIDRQKPTVMQATPATWMMLFQAGWKNRERVKILCGGEALSDALKQEFLRTSSEAWNMYGPTETTIWSTVGRVTADTPTTIGRPIANTDVYVLDACLQLVPIGVPGELYIAGTGVAQGYHRKPALTAERFVAHPFRSGAVLYRTGDRARWRADGTIEYLGRLDQQVKIRGFRIETGEIEAQLRAQGAINDCVVIARTLNASPQLVAYCEMSGEHVEPADLRDVLACHLPGYMIPAAFVRVEQIPRSASGKIDRAALLQVPVTTRRSATIVQAASEAEREMLGIWKQVLNRDDVGVEDGFFDAGGDSILATALVERIRRVVGVPIDVMTIFRYTTARAMAKYLSDLRQSAGPQLHGDRRDPAAVSARRSDPPPDYYDESLAIIGISCQFPGADSPEAFWHALRAGRESVRACALEELTAAGIPDDVVHAPGYIAIQSSIEAKDCFDPEFFGMTARDAAWMDFQFRLLMMHAWKACEDAAYRPAQLSRCAVFMSASNSFYQAPLSQFPAHGHDVLLESEEYVAWVLAQGGSIPTMISHKLGLTGASAFVHSNCSSSLMALQLAHQAIQVGDSETALVGAATIFPSSNLGYCHRPGLNFSGGGHVRAFDARADGTIPGEGVAVILVKNASAALRDGDHIYCLVRGVGVNNDGSDKVGFYAPSVRGQSEVIGRLLKKTGIHPESIQYVEAHGTGTTLGDPIEFAALCDAYREHTDKLQFCGLGSVKSNIGHLDTAAGLAGIIKVALGLKHGELPPTINYSHANQLLDLGSSPFYVVDSHRVWPAASGVARAAVSAFGLGGTNTHAILERCLTPADRSPSASVFAESDRAVSRSLSRLIPLSARTHDALIARVRALRAALRTSGPQLRLEDVAYTLQVGRVAMAERLMFVVESLPELIERLTAYLESGESPSVRQTTIRMSFALSMSSTPDDGSRMRCRDALQRGDLDFVVDAWLEGIPIDWDTLYVAPRPSRVSLPTYDFAREQYRLPASTARNRSEASSEAVADSVGLFVSSWEPYDVCVGSTGPSPAPAHPDPL